MPASNERIPNKPLSGSELKEIILKDVDFVLTRDGMLSHNIAFGRVSYEVRVSIHMDNPLYPEHISVILSRAASKQQVEANPSLSSIEPTPPLKNTSDVDVVFSEEIHREISSPNMARIEASMPVFKLNKNLDTGVVEEIPIKYSGDTVNPGEVGNKKVETRTVEDQSRKWGKSKK